MQKMPNETKEFKYTTKWIRLFDKLLILYFFFYLSLFITDYSFVFSYLHKKIGLPFKYISSISVPTTVLLFSLLFRYIVERKSFFASWLIKRLYKMTQVGNKKLLFLSISIISILFLILSIARHLSLSSGSFDLGIFDQAIWNTLQGDILFSSLKNNINLLGDHFEPILLLIVPLYKLWSNVIVLFILQSLLLASTVIPLYLIAKGRLKERVFIFAFVISFILSKPLRGVGLSDFHLECFILPLLFWIYYFLIKRNNLLLYLTVFVLLLCKEDTVFLISALGLFAWFLQRRIKLGIILFMIGIIGWFLETRFIIPYFNPKGVYEHINKLPFGLTYMDNIKAIFSNPLLLGRFIFDKMKIEYCFKLLGPLGFISIFSPMHYILIAVPLLKNLLATENFSGYYKISSHYTASIIPFIYISAIYGAGWLTEKVHYKRISLFISLFILFSSLIFYGKTDAYKFSNFLNTIKTNHTLEKISYLHLIPENASVSTNFNLVPHMSHRKYIFDWNPQAKTSYITEYVVIDKNLLGYLTNDDIKKIGPYLDDIINRGYKQIFSTPDKTFLIFHNPDIDKSLVEKVSLVSGK